MKEAGYWPHQLIVYCDVTLLHTILHRKKATVLLGEEYKLLFHAHTLATWLLSLSARDHDGEDKGPCDYQWL
jgi:hypothetical protein